MQLNTGESINECENSKISFYRIPKELFTDKRYAELSIDAKLLYGILTDRMELSAYNGWQDEWGRVYLYFTVEQVCELLGVGTNKAVKIFKELENLALIERKRQGLGKSSVIYIKTLDFPKGEFCNCENENSRSLKKGIQDFPKSKTNHTEYNHTEINHTESSFIFDDELLIKKLKYQIEYDVLLERMDKDKLDEIMGMIADLMSIRSPVIRIGKYEYPQSAVYARMKQIRAEHIEFALERLEETKGQIHDMRSYLTTLLFYAPITMENYYRAEVNRDFGWT